MFIVISPSKKQDFQTPSNTELFSSARLLSYSQMIINELKNFSLEEIIKLLNISYGLAENNIKHLNQWIIPFTKNIAKQAILAFDGDVYEGMNPKSFNDEDFDFAQKTIRIISGLYGVLKPLDLIMPYRLPFGTKLINSKGRNLYDFWGNIITDTINDDLKQTKNNTLVNLASAEYFKPLNINNLKAKVVEVVFKEKNNGVYRVVSFHAKQARGLMTNYVVKNKLLQVEDLQSFSEDGYLFDKKQSKPDKYIFVRQ